jgi:thioredoxin-related protein
MIKCLKLTRWQSVLLVLVLFPVHVPAADEESFDILGIDDSPRIRDVQYPSWFKLSFLDLQEDLDEAVANLKQGIIVYFSQKDCGYCEIMAKVNFGREKDIVQYTRKHFDVVPIDIWGSREVNDMEGHTLAERDYAVREKTNFTPSMIYYDKDGNEALRLRGYYPPYKFRAALEYVVDGFYKKETFRDYLARADPPPKFEVGDLNYQEFFQAPPYALDRSRFPAQRPLVVFFEQRDCHACDILHTDPLSDKYALEFLKGFEAIQLDMWSDTPVLTPDGQRLTALEWAGQLGLFYAPALVFFDERGKEIIRIDSVVRLYRLRGVLEYVLHKGYLEAPTFQRWREMQSQRRAVEEE